MVPFPTPELHDRSTLLTPHRTMRDRSMTDRQTSHITNESTMPRTNHAVAKHHVVSPPPTQPPRTPDPALFLQPDLNRPRLT